MCIAAPRAAESAVHDTRDQEELSQIHGKTGQVQQERDRRVQAPEETQQSGTGEHGELAGRHRRADVPAGERQEGKAQQLRAVREGEGGGHEHVRGLFGLAPGQARLVEERLAAFGQEREHDEHVRGDERGHDRIQGDGHDAPIRQAGERRYESGQQREGEEQGQADVDQEKGLEPLEFVEAHRTRGMAGDGEKAIGRQPDDEISRAPQRLVHHAERPEDPLLLRQRLEDRRAEEDGKKHDRRHQVVGEGAEGIRWDVELQPIDARLDRDVGRRVERSSLLGGQGQRAREHQGEAERPQDHQDEPALRRQPTRLLACGTAHAGHERRDEIRKDGDLQELEERLGGQTEERRALAKEEPDRDPGGQTDEDPAREAHERGV